MRKFVASCNLQLERGLIHCDIYKICSGYDVTMSGVLSGVSPSIMRYYKDSNVGFPHWRLFLLSLVL